MFSGYRGWNDVTGEYTADAIAGASDSSFSWSGVLKGIQSTIDTGASLTSTVKSMLPRSVTEKAPTQTGSVVAKAPAATGVPTWVWYAGGGVAALLIGTIIYKAVKK